MNKYLEKIAGFTPRYVGRAIKEGVPNMIADLKGVGSRAAKAHSAHVDLAAAKAKIEDAKGSVDYHKAISKAFGRGPSTSVNVGNAEARLHKLKTTTNFDHLARRVGRAAKAEELSRKSAKGVLKRTAGGAALTATALTGVAATSKKD